VANIFPIYLSIYNHVLSKACRAKWCCRKGYCELIAIGHIKVQTHQKYLSHTIRVQ